MQSILPHPLLQFMLCCKSSFTPTSSFAASSCDIARSDLAGAMHHLLQTILCLRCRQALAAETVALEEARLDARSKELRASAAAEAAAEEAATARAKLARLASERESLAATVTSLQVHTEVDVHIVISRWNHTLIITVCKFTWNYISDYCAIIGVSSSSRFAPMSRSHSDHMSMISINPQGHPSALTAAAFSATDRHNVARLCCIGSFNSTNVDIACSAIPLIVHYRRVSLQTQRAPTSLRN